MISWSSPRLPPRLSVSALTWIAIGLSIFWLPYQFPPHRSDQSLSALAGFNNNVAIAALFAGVLLLTVLRWRKSPGPAFQASNPMPLTPLLVLCLLQTVITATLLIGVNGHPPAGEAHYLLSRTYPLASGMLPYRDYEFLYGPLLVYLPYWIAKLLAAPLYPVYILVFLAFQLAGLYMLWKIISISTAPVRTKIVAFCCLGAVTLPNLSLGLQYTLPRYLTAFCAILAFAAFTRANPARPIRLVLAYTLLLAAVFGLSPEMGLAFIPAAIAVLFAQSRETRHRPTAGALALLAALAALVLLLPAGMLEGVTSFSKGGNSFPIVPAAFVLFYLITVLIAGPHLLLALRQADPRALPFPPDVTFGWLVLSLGMAPGALNRADGGHIFFYGIGFFLFLLLGAGLSSMARNVYTGFFVLVFCVLVTYTTFYVYFDDLKLPLPRNLLGERRWKTLKQSNEWERREAADLDRLDAELPSTGSLCVPFGESAISYRLASRGAFQPDYFVGLIGVYTRADVKKKIASLARCRGIVAPLAEMAPQQPDPDDTILYLRSLFKHLFLYPAKLKIDRRQLLTDIKDPIRDYCMRHFRLQTKLGTTLGLYTPISTSGVY